MSILVSVCVCTFKRPAELVRLLNSLVEQLPDNDMYEVIVVDNDAAGSARSSIEAFKASKNYINLSYFIEATPGVTYARNRCVNESRGQYLAFIDDDEIAGPRWLVELIAVKARTGADAVLGPVIPLFPTGSKQWVKDSGFFSRRRFRTGTVLPENECRTGNALVQASIARKRSPEVFSNRFSSSGGEDRDFFSWMASEGFKIVWCDTAIVEEEVPLNRQSIYYMIERSYKSSATYWGEKMLRMSRIQVGWQVILGIFGGSISMFLGVILAPLGYSRAVPFLCKAAKGVGRLAAVFKVDIRAYSGS